MSSHKRMKLLNGNHNHNKNDIGDNINENDEVRIDNVDWQTILHQNQLFFSVLEFIGFPKCLRLASVESSWRKRIWPHQVLNQDELKSATIKKRGRRIIRKYVYDAQSVSRSIVSADGVFGSYIKKAVFRSFPTTRFRQSNIFRQLVVTYSKLDTITFEGQNFDYNGWKMDEKAVTVFFKALINGENQVQSNQPKELKEVTFKNCGIFCHSFCDLIDSFPNLIVQKLSVIYEAGGLCFFKLPERSGCLNVEVAKRDYNSGTSSYIVQFITFSDFLKSICSTVNIFIGEYFLLEENDSPRFINLFSNCENFSLRIGKVLTPYAYKMHTKNVKIRFFHFESLKTLTVSKNLSLCDDQIEIFNTQNVKIEFV